MSHQSLGAVPLPAGTIEHDMTMLERYQKFSAELLRISLIAISAVGYAFSKILFPEESGRVAKLTFEVRGLVIFALAFLCFSAAAALLHRYAAVDSISWHLQAVRRSIRNQGDDSTLASRDFRRRHTCFFVSRWAIALSALSLGIGAILIVLAIVKSLR